MEKTKDDQDRDLPIFQHTFSPKEWTLVSDKTWFSSPIDLFVLTATPLHFSYLHLPKVKQRHFCSIPVLTIETHQSEDPNFSLMNKFNGNNTKEKIYCAYSCWWILFIWLSNLNYPQNRLSSSSCERSFSNSCVL